MYEIFSHSQLNYWRASVASETLTGVTQLKIGDVCLFIYLFVYMFGRMYVIKRVRGELFFSKKHGFLGLTPVYSELQH